MNQVEPLWWQNGVVYEIYPRSFADANGDGIGDLDGITGRLDHLEWLGVDAIWVAPFYPSPMADLGYDVTDHTGVDPRFGDLAAFDRMLAEAHRRRLRVIIDYVPNHTSDRHPWFVASRSSRDDPKRDWYIWHDATDSGGPPNNWLSMFGGPAWEWDAVTGQYYLHSFLAAQPDLNWRNGEVRDAMFDVARFWLDRGVDGFRIDVAQFIGKDQQLRDNPPNPHPERMAHLGAWGRQLHLYDIGQPYLHEVYRDFRRLLDGYGSERPRVSIGELHHPEFEVWASFYGEQLDEIHLPFNFHLMRAPWTAGDVRAVVDGVEAALPEGAWANWVLGNHDQPRIASRIGPAQARVAMVLVLTLHGSPTLYYGDELGMRNVPVPTERSHDPWERNEPGQGRDPQRSPMPWDDSRHAGFCPPHVEPWLPLGDDARHVNVAAQSTDPTSMLSLTRHLLQLRREHPALRVGSYRPIDTTVAGCFCFMREAPGSLPVLIALNLTDSPLEVSAIGPGRVLAGTHPDRSGTRLPPDSLELRADEGLVIERA